MEATDDLAESHYSKAVTAESRLQWLQEGMGSEEMGPLSIDVPMTGRLVGKVGVGEAAVGTKEHVPEDLRSTSASTRAVYSRSRP